MSTEGTPPPVLDPAVEPTPEAPRAPTATEIAWAENQHVVANGASWFTWIAGLTVINALLAAFGVEFGLATGFFIAGGVTWEFIDQGATAVGVGIAVVVAALYFGLGILAGRGARWAFVLGLVILILDTLPAFLDPGKMIMGIAIHLWAIWNMTSAIFAIGRLKKMSRGEAV